MVPFFVKAQNRFTISGFIKDSLNGETLIGASIAVQGKKKVSAVTSMVFILSL